MLKDGDILELRAKVADLEAELRRIQKRRKHWRQGALAAAVLCVSAALWAQTPQGPLTLQSLAQRVSDLEKRVTNDEASGTNIPQTADTGTTPGKPPAGSTANSDANLEQRVSSLETNVTDLIDLKIQERFVNDELKLSQLEKSFVQLQSQISASGQGPGTPAAKGKPATSTATAPFQVVNSSGKVLLSVEDDVLGASLKLFNSSGKDVVALQSIQDTGLGTFTDSSGDNTAIIGLSSGHPLVEVGEGKQYVAVGRMPGEPTTGMGVHVVGSSGEDLISLENSESRGNLLIRKNKTIVGIFAANAGNEGATLSTFGDGARNALEAGIDNDTGEPTLSILSKKGAQAKVGANASGSMGVRLFASGLGKVPIVTLADQLNGSGAVLVTDGKTPLAGIGVDEGHGRVGVTDGKSWLGAIKSNGDGAEVYVANATGQEIAVMSADPSTKTGQVLVYDSGGTPLGKMSIQGNHGDVQLNSGDKQVDVWKFLLLPLH